MAEYLRGNIDDNDMIDISDFRKTNEAFSRSLDSLLNFS